MDNTSPHRPPATDFTAVLGLADTVALRFLSYLDLNSSTVVGHVSPLAIANVVSLESLALDAAITTPGKDFEDMLHYKCAVANKLSTIVTRNVKDYPWDAVTIVTPREFLSMDSVDKSTKHPYLNL